MKSPVLLEEAGRLTMRENDAAVSADFTRGPNRIIVEDVRADEALRNTGADDRFMQALAAHARDKRLKIESRCAYVDRWFDGHPDHADLRVERQQAQDGTQGALAGLDDGATL